MKAYNSVESGYFSGISLFYKLITSFEGEVAAVLMKFDIFYSRLKDMVKNIKKAGKLFKSNML